MKVKGNDHLADIFEKNAIYASPYKYFNDPFDCSFFIDPTSFTQNNIQTWSANLSQPLNITTNTQIITNTIQDKLSNLLIKKGIICFASKSDNILMWSHYTDNHKGICLGFETSKDSTFFQKTLSVNYTNIYPIYKLPDNYGIFLVNVFRTKFEVWKYEEEYRKYSDSIGTIQFNKIALTDVFLGCEISNNDKCFVECLLNKYGYNHVNVKQYQKDTSNFQLV